MSRTSLPILSMRLVVNMYLRAHNYVLPKIEPLPVNDGLRQLLIADVNILIGENIFDTNSDPFGAIICVLGVERREHVMSTIAAAELQIRARLQCRVPARSQKRKQVNNSDEFNIDKNTDAKRRDSLNSQLMRKVDEEAELAASESVARIMHIAQTAAKESASSKDVLRSIMDVLHAQLSERLAVDFEFEK
jgi:hypothetical protein